MAIEIVDFPIKNGGSFHGKMLVHQRVTMVFFGSVLKLAVVNGPMFLGIFVVADQTIADHSHFVAATPISVEGSWRFMDTCTGYL